MKNLYNIQCPYCQANLTAKPSLLHRAGYHDIGGGRCLMCQKWMKLIYQVDSDTMQAKKLEQPS